MQRQEAQPMRLDSKEDHELQSMRVKIQQYLGSELKLKKKKEFAAETDPSSVEWFFYFKFTKLWSFGNFNV